MVFLYSEPQEEKGRCSRDEPVEPGLPVDRAAHLAPRRLLAKGEEAHHAMPLPPAAAIATAAAAVPAITAATAAAAGTGGCTISDRATATVIRSELAKVL